MQFKEHEIWILIIGTSTLLIFIIGIFFLLILISRKRKLNYQQMIIEEKIKSQNLEIEKKDILIKERERIIKDMHDDIGGSLNSIRLISDVILEHKLPEEKMFECISKIALTSKNISQHIKMVVWSLDVEKDSLINLIEYVNVFTVDLFQYSPIALKLNTNLTFKDYSINGFFRKNIFLVIKESLTNIQKHSLATNAEIKIEVINNNLLIEIKDNGIGFEGTNSNGNGIKNIKNRISEINGHITFSNFNGTKLKIIAPLN